MPGGAHALEKHLLALLQQVSGHQSSKKKHMESFGQWLGLVAPTLVSQFLILSILKGKSVLNVSHNRALPKGHSQRPACEAQGERLQVFK